MLVLWVIFLILENILSFFFLSKKEEEMRISKQDAVKKNLGYWKYSASRLEILVSLIIQTSVFLGVPHNYSKS